MNYQRSAGDRVSSKPVGIVPAFRGVVVKRVGDEYLVERFDGQRWMRNDFDLEVLPSALIDWTTFREILTRLGAVGKADIEWAESRSSPPDAEEFALEAIYVICNSGMKFEVARGIYNKVLKALVDRQPVSSVFGHLGKATAIETIWDERARIFTEYMAAPDKVEYCGSLPWIGEITKYHLAKNFGADVAKPDRHLQRLADAAKMTPQEFCADLAADTGYRIATIDTLLWRACATGVLDPYTGRLKDAA